MMDLNAPGSYSGVLGALVRDASRLHEGERCPIDVEVMARRLGLRVCLEPNASALGGLHHGPHGRKVTVRGHRLDNARVRFTAAHEIGHHLLDLYGVGRPADRREYWAIERLCNAFAGHLLVPDAAVEWTREAIADGPHALLCRTRVLAERALVSRAAVSHRLGPELGNVAFCEIAFASPPATGIAGIVRWIVEHVLWLGRGPRAKLEAGHFLGPLLHWQAQKEVGAVATGVTGGRLVASERRPGGVWIVCTGQSLAPM
jgi:hypothetical protein